MNALMGFEVLEVLRRQLELKGEFFITAAVSEVGTMCGISDQAAWRRWELFKGAFPDITSALRFAPKEKMPKIFERIFNEIKVIREGYSTRISE